MMSNIGRIIKDFYCNGFAGRRYDLTNAVIEAEGKDWIVLRLENTELVMIEFYTWVTVDKDEQGVCINAIYRDGWHFKDKQKMIDEWCKTSG